MEAQHLASRKSSSLHSDHHHHPQGSFTFVVCVSISTRESINRATYGFYDDLQAFLRLEVSHISSWNYELLTPMDVKRRNINPKPYHIVVSDSVHWHAWCGFGTTYCRHRRQEFLIPIGIVIKVHGILFYFKTPTTPLSGPSNVSVSQDGMLWYLRQERLGVEGNRGLTFILDLVLLKQALVETNEWEIYERLTAVQKESKKGSKGAVGTQFVSQRARIILEEVRRHALFTRHECLEFIGMLGGSWLILAHAFVFHDLSILDANFLCSRFRV